MACSSFATSWVTALSFDEHIGFSGSWLMIRTIGSSTSLLTISSLQCLCLPSFANLLLLLSFVKNEGKVAWNGCFDQDADDDDDPKGNEAKADGDGDGEDEEDDVDGDVRYGCNKR